MRRTYRSLVSAMYIIHKFIIDEYRKSTCPWKIQFSQSDRPNHYTSHNATWFVNWPIILLVSTPLCILRLPPHNSKEKHSHNSLYGIPSLAFFSKMLKLNDTLHTWVSNNILSIKSTNLIKHINLICSIYVIYHFADQYKTKN